VIAYQSFRLKVEKSQFTSRRFLFSLSLKAPMEACNLRVAGQGQGLSTVDLDFSHASTWAFLWRCSWRKRVYRIKLKNSIC